MIIIEASDVAERPVVNIVSHFTLQVFLFCLLFTENCWCRIMHVVISSWNKSAIQGWILRKALRGLQFDLASWYLLIAFACLSSAYSLFKCIKWMVLEYPYAFEHCYIYKETMSWSRSPGVGHEDIAITFQIVHITIVSLAWEWQGR